MKVSLNWLKEFVDIKDISLQQLEELISFNIIEIEEIKALCEASNLTIGYVCECVNHPNSDHLHICKVDLGDQIEQIVCGAPNVDRGQKVIVAKVGAVLPGDFKIKASKIRGVESNGMICSLQELGFEEKYIPEEFKNGIYVLDENAPLGVNPLEYLGIDDITIELGLTPNRGDLLSMLGVAYDVAAVVDKKVKYNEPIINEIGKENDVKVNVTAKTVKGYFTRKIENVTICESPWWIKSRLIACGIRPINNVVDITNYVMLELGQPLHAFDGDLLGNKILVRNAFDGEKIITLDEVERVLTEDDVVITDGVMPLCLAGVMGGANSGISETTKTVVLESAYFDPATVRATSSRVGLRSDSSMRFERKIDPNRVILALNRAAELIEELAGGSILSGINGFDNLDCADKCINVSLAGINKALGTDISVAEVSNILARLGIKYFYSKAHDTFDLSVPTRRVDIENYQDINEEIARIYGFNNIPTTIPESNKKGSLSNKQRINRRVREIMQGLGLQECVNYSLESAQKAVLFELDNENPVKLAMPMTEERAVLRRSLVSGLVDVIKYNMARKNNDVAIYEIGKIYSTDKEEVMISAAITNVFESSLWQGKKQVADFYLLKGMLDELLQRLGLMAEYKASSHPSYHPGRQAMVIVDGKSVGIIGEIHPKLAKENDLNRVYVFELSLDKLLDVNTEEVKFSPISKFPSMTRDIAIIVDKEIEASKIIDVIKLVGKKMISDVSIFDVYEGSNIDDGKKSIAVSITFVDKEQTLESADVDKKVRSIINRLEELLGASLRA